MLTISVEKFILMILGILYVIKRYLRVTAEWSFPLYIDNKVWDYPEYGNC